jgi:hypothetical protein
LYLLVIAPEPNADIRDVSEYETNIKTNMKIKRI